eukprot:2821823-Prymnesium_polylepis.1
MTTCCLKSDLQKRGIEAGQLKRVRGVLGKPQESWGYARVSLGLARTETHHSPAFVSLERSPTCSGT